MNNRLILLSAILAEAANVKKMPPLERDAWLASCSDGLIAPRLPTPKGAFLYNTMAGQNALEDLVDDFVKPYVEDGDLKRDEVNLAVRKCCGEMIASSSYRGKSVEELLEILEMYVFARTRMPSCTWVHYIPCMLFEDNEPAVQFEIGPIYFVPRAQFEAGLSSNEQAAPWQSLMDSAELNDQIRSNAWATLRASLSGSNWVAWTSDTGFDYETSRENALVNVELAINFLQLTFDQESSRTIRHKWDRRPPLLVQRLSQAKGSGQLLKLQHAPEMDVETLAGFSRSLVPSRRDFFSKAGARISSVIKGGDHSDCPNISERWLTSLFWFGKSLREPLDSSAIIALGASLDIFGRTSGNISQMTAFCSGLFKIKESAFVYGSSMTLKQVVSLIYADGRSQLIHGSKAVLKADYSEMREKSEAFVRLLLIRALERIDDYTKIRELNAQVRDNFDDFVRFVISGRPR